MKRERGREQKNRCGQPINYLIIAVPASVVVVVVAIVVHTIALVDLLCHVIVESNVVPVI